MNWLNVIRREKEKKKKINEGLNLSISGELADLAPSQTPKKILNQEAQDSMNTA